MIYESLAARVVVHSQPEATFDHFFEPASDHNVSVS
jgi:hypothetical protein